MWGSGEAGWKLFGRWKWPDLVVAHLLGENTMLLSGGRKNHSCFPSCKYSVLFFFCFWYGVVCSKLVRVSSRIPQIYHLTTLTAGGLEGENWKPAGHRLKLRANGKSCLSGQPRGCEGPRMDWIGALRVLLASMSCFPIGSFGVLWHETPAGLCLLARSISSHFLDSTRPSWILIVPSRTHRPCLSKLHILWID